MRTFQCPACGKKVQTEPEASCAPDALKGEKIPYHCGRPMRELMDD